MTATHNIEAIARAIETRRRPASWPPSEHQDWMDRGYWKVTAAYIEAGLIDDAGNERPHSFEQGEAAWLDWLARHRQDMPHIRRT
jgi:hypothetical protein